MNGFSFKANLFVKHGLPILRITNIKNGIISFENCVYFDQNDYSKNLEQFKVKKNDILIAMSGVTTGKIGINLLDNDGYLNQRVGKFIPNTKLIKNKFLYHCLRTKENYFYNISKNSGSQPNLSTSKILELLVPIPPLEIQEKIVEILDKFTELTTELTLRKKQYEYYRDKLLTFNENEVEYRPLRGLILLNSFKQVSANKISELIDPNGTIPLLPSSQNYDWFTTKEKCKNLVCKGNVITLGRARHPNIKSAQGEFVSSNNIIIQSLDETKISFRFLYHFINKHKFDFYIETSTYPKFDSKTFKNFLIPIPPLEVQEKIVAILDQFSQLVEGVENSIPCEIKLRQKQYEYYRDKLLTFKQKHK